VKITRIKTQSCSVRVLVRITRIKTQICSVLSGF
jgi:hypothetical protein